MRVSMVSGVLIIAGGVLFGAALMIIARVLPSGSPPAAIAVIDRGGTAILTPAAGAGVGVRSAAAGAANDMAPPARTSQAGALRVLDLRIVDATMRDRNGHAPRRALTQDELEELAPSFDVVADDMAAQPDGTPLSAEDIATLHRAHPGIRVVRVLETLTSNDPAYPGIRPDDGVHSDWFLTDGAGQPALVYGGNAAWNGEPNFALDPASEPVRLAIAARARQYMLLGYDGVWLAGVRTVPPVLASGEAHHRGGERYGPAEWREASAGVIAAVRRLAPGAAIYVDKADADAVFAAASGAIAADR